MLKAVPGRKWLSGIGLARLRCLPGQSPSVQQLILWLSVLPLASSMW